MRVTALAGGVGGAKLVDGLAQILPPQDLTIIVNTGDDFQHLGLEISPDIDTVCYTLAGLANPLSGWGRENDTFMVMAGIQRLGGPAWFRLGDQDLATHLERTRRLRSGEPLSQVTRDLASSLGVRSRLLPMSNDPVRTMVRTEELGEIPFQEYFVLHRCEPRVQGFRFAGADTARPAPGVLKVMEEADLIVICPSNPWVSIDPILAVPGIRASLEYLYSGKLHKKLVIAISPIIAGKTIKGPAAKMYAELGIQPSALAILAHYSSLLTGFVIDRVDGKLAPEVRIPLLITNTLMNSRIDRRQLAQDVLDFAGRI